MPIYQSQLDIKVNRKTALAIFVKTPGISPVKTRLAATLGKEKAEQLFLLCLRAIAAVATQAQLATQSQAQHQSQNKSQHQNQAGVIVPHWAIAEPEALDHPLWQNFPRLHSGTGSLGQRLDHVYRTLRATYDQVILIGADSPQLTARSLITAAASISASNNISDSIRANTSASTSINARINQPQSVICPTYDGGYALFGSQSEIPTSVWLETPYSSAETMAVFLSKLQPITRVKKMPPISDIDHEADILTICQEMSKIDLLPEQVEFLRWCKQELNLPPDLNQVLREAIGKNLCEQKNEQN